MASTPPYVSFTTTLPRLSKSSQRMSPQEQRLKQEAEHYSQDALLHRRSQSIAHDQGHQSAIRAATARVQASKMAMNVLTSITSPLDKQHEERWVRELMEMYDEEVDDDFHRRFIMTLRRLTSDESIYVRSLETMSKRFWLPLEQLYTRKQRKSQRRWFSAFNLSSHYTAGSASHSSLPSFMGSLSSLTSSSTSLPMICAADPVSAKLSSDHDEHSTDSSSTESTSNNSPTIPERRVTSLNPLDVLERMFFYLPTLIELHSGISNLFKILLNKCPSVQGLVTIFQHSLARFKVYSGIINRDYVSALVDFENLQYIDARFRRAVEECSESTDWIRIRTLLMRPRSRIHYYVTMLSTVRDCCVAPDNAELIELIDWNVKQLEKINQQISGWNKVIESIERLAQLQSRMQGMPIPLLSPEQQLFMEGDVLYRESNHTTATFQSIHCWLFADRIVLAKSCGEEKYLIKTIFLLDYACVYACRLTTGPYAYQMLVSTGQYGIILDFGNAQQFERWRQQFLRGLDHVYRSRRGTPQFKEVDELPLSNNRTSAKHGAFLKPT